MDDVRLRSSYDLMVLIRRFEEETERQYKKARIGGYCHLASGQEAATVGVVEPMQEDDVLFTSYRDHAFALARGISPEAVMAELFGRCDGCARGRGGSMHLADPERNYLGGWGIVAGQLPLATGAGFSIVQRDEQRAVLCELGEGAVNMGAWHESLNLAGIWDLPVVFVVMNNYYGMGTSVDKASAEPEVHKRAAAFRMRGERVDGQDLEAVHGAAGELLAEARDERRPSVLELMTYRYRGHSVADAGKAYRSEEEIDGWRERDPIVRLAERLGLSEDEVAEVDERAQGRVDEAVAFAEQSDFPDVDGLARHVYGDPKSPEQFSRMVLGSPHGERELVFEGDL